MNANALALCVAMSLGITGCGFQTQKSVSDSNDPATEGDPAMQQLVSIARSIQSQDSISDALNTRRYNLDTAPNLPERRMPMDLRRIISFPGGQQFPLETAIKILSKKGHLSYLPPQGHKPLAGIYVFFDDQLRTVGDYISDAATQAGYRADVVLDLSARPRTVQIKYREPRF